MAGRMWARGLAIVMLWPAAPTLAATPSPNVSVARVAAAAYQGPADETSLFIAGAVVDGTRPPGDANNEITVVGGSFLCESGVNVVRFFRGVVAGRAVIDPPMRSARITADIPVEEFEIRAPGCERPDFDHATTETPATGRIVHVVASWIARSGAAPDVEPFATYGLNDCPLAKVGALTRQWASSTATATGPPVAATTRTFKDITTNDAIMATRPLAWLDCA